MSEEYVSIVPKIELGLDSINVKAAIAEFIAVMFLVFVGCGTASTFALVTVDGSLQLPSAKTDANSEAQLVNIAIMSMNTNACWGLTTALAFGFGIAVLVYMTAHTSGGQVNPAVSLSLMLSGRLPIAQGIVNQIFQYSGAILGAAFLRAFLPHGDSSTLAANEVSPGVGQGSALLGEIMMTCILCVTVLETVCNPRSSVQMLAPLAIGLSIFLGHAVLIPIDGCCINPARWFGPAVVSGKAWQHVSWIFIVGPYIGAMFAAIIHCFSSSSLGNPENFVRQKKVIMASEEIDVDNAAAIDHVCPPVAPPATAI